MWFLKSFSVIVKIVSFSSAIFVFCHLNDNDSFGLALFYWYATDTLEHAENVEKYLLYSGICSIPESFSTRRELVSVTRAVCRSACSNIFDNDCSGFVYNRRTQTCTLSPYTGEWLPASADDCDPQTGLEFYRRIRLSGTSIHCHCDVQTAMQIVK